MALLKSLCSLRRHFLSLLGLTCLCAPASAQIDTVRALLDHITPGYTHAELVRAQGMGFQATLDEQLANYGTLAHVESDIANAWSAVGMIPNDVALNYSINAGGSLADEQMQNARIYRWVYSKQAFYERMTWFWSNHFNTDVHKRVLAATLPYFDATVCRRAPFSNFRSLVHASSGVPYVRPLLTPGYSQAGPMAVLLYLDNYTNKCSGPNENYAREVLELHVLGNRNLFSGDARQAYTELEIRDLAKMLTGWTIETTAGTTRFQFVFDDVEHCSTGGPYSFLGQSININATHPTEGFEALDHAIDYVDTANGWGHVSAVFLAEKLTRAFLTDASVLTFNGTQILAIRRAVDDATLAFGTHGNISNMLRAILTEQNLTDILGQTNPGYKYKGPLHFMSSALRAVVPTIDPMGVGTDKLREILEGLGQEPFGFGPPIGFPEAIAVWAGNQPGRWDFAYELLLPVLTGSVYTYGNIDGVSVDVPRLYLQLGSSGFDRGTSAQQANDIIAGGKLSAGSVQIIQDYVNQSTDPDEVIMSRVLFLAILAPEFNVF